ncbi:16842_t:CDS:2, partial [Racocetra persica]
MAGFCMVSNDNENISMLSWWHSYSPCISASIYRVHHSRSITGCENMLLLKIDTSVVGYT